MNWKASNLFGWGLVGLNVFYHWALSGEVHPVMGQAIDESDLAMMNPFRRARIEQRVAESNRIAAEIQATPGKTVKVDWAVIHALGNAFVPAETRVVGSSNVGRIVFEDTRTLDNAEVHSLPYDSLICISEWNARLLRQACSAEVVVAHEGIDASQFFPGPRSGALERGRFYVFSGGKLEFRKGQDIVLLAFRAFAARHDDAVLVTNWHSPWDRLAAGFRGRADRPAELNDAGRLDISRWASDNGVDPSRVIDLGPTPNPLMPAVLREMDCAIFPNRCEGGTNLVAMEAMACGVPVVLARNTGVADIIREGNCMVLEQQAPVISAGAVGTEGWGEPDVDELVAALEKLYGSDDLRRETGTRGVEFVRERTWEKHSDIMKQAVLSA